MSDILPLRLRAAAASVAARRLWRDLDLDLDAGELVAVVGPNGSGKTTLLRSVLGLHRLDAGTIELDGMSPRRGRTRAGYLPQLGFRGDTGLRARDLVGLTLGGTRPGIPWVSARERRAVDALLERVGATDLAAEHVDGLSGGELQRVRLAQALAGSPRLLLLDEPLLGLDAHGREVLARLITSEHERAEAGILVVTHDLEPLRPVVDGVLTLGGAGGGVELTRPVEARVA